jgi:tetratricopeptide (TPR) repeat protein
VTQRARAGLAALLLLAACGSPEQRFARHLERAAELAAGGDTRAAVLEYMNALKLQPESAEVHERIADLYRGQSRFADALDWYREAFRLDPGRISAAMGEARLLLFQDPKRARELVNIGLREAPDLPLVHVTASQLALAQGRTQAALVEAERAAELGPEDPGPLVQLGAVHQARIRESQRRRQRPPDDAFEAAIAVFEKLDRLAEGSPRARMERARTLGAWGRHAEAVAGYEAAIDLAVERGLVAEAVAVGEALDTYARERRDVDLRRSALRRIVSLKNDEYQAWDRLARLVDGQLGRKGEEVYLELLGQRPEDPQAHVLYVNYLQREGRDAEAAQHLERTIEEGLHDPALWDQILRVRISQGSYAEARRALARMSDEHPGDPATRVAAARLAIAEGRYDEGIDALEAIVAEREEFEPLRLLALAYHRRGDGRDARAAMDRALALSPRPPLAVLRLDARIDHANGDWAGVLRSFQIVAARGEDLSPEERILGAAALYHTGRRALGRAILEEILASADPPREAALELARLERRRDPERAHRALREAVARHPLDPELLEALTEIEVARGEAEVALVRLDEIVASGRARPRVLLARARLLRDTGALDRAEADALRAFEANPELPGAADLLFQIYQAQGRLAQVYRSFEQAEAAGILHPGARTLLARLALVSGDTGRARDLLEEVLRDHPRMREARRDLALVLAERGEELQRALELARQAEGNEDDPLPDAVDAVGFVHLRSGRAAPALAAFQRAVRLAADRPDGREPTYHYHVGLALRALGREAQAIAAFEQALGNGEFPEAESARRELEAARAGAASAQKPS